MPGAGRPSPSGRDGTAAERKRDDGEDEGETAHDGSLSRGSRCSPVVFRLLGGAGG